MGYKAVARFFYANIPGLAAIRFAAMDANARYFIKPEFRGILRLSVGQGLIIEVGASRGQSIAAFKKLAPACSIIAFEPEPRAAKKLALRYRRDENVIVHSCALAERPGTVTLFVPRYGWWGCEGMAATNRKTATEWLSDPGRMFCYNKAKLSVEECLIQCRTLDSYNLTPVLIKLHAQGAELEILNGSYQTIRRHNPALMCAYPSVELVDRLADWSYRPYIYSDGRFARGVARRPVTFTWFLTDQHVD